MDIKVFRMTTGEEVIASIISENDASYVVEHPLKFVISQQNMGFSQIMYLTERKTQHTFFKTAIMVMAEPIEDVADKYREEVTGIKVPSRSIIT